MHPPLAAGDMMLAAIRFLFGRIDVAPGVDFTPSPTPLPTPSPSHPKHNISYHGRQTHSGHVMFALEVPVIAYVNTT
ncbi:hypothetical protein J6590_011527 [Homalodisca vitripennis]|nr:hypothetical protein J6590_011527 [Homalodisca vitripennis]